MGSGEQEGSEEVMRCGNHAKLAQDGGMLTNLGKLENAAPERPKEREGGPAYASIGKFCKYGAACSRCRLAYFISERTVAAPANHWFSDAINTIMPSFLPYLRERS